MDACARCESDGGIIWIIASQYLRDDTTMSAVAEVYESGSGQLLTLVGLWWIRGESALAKDVHSCYLVVERAFNLKELVFFMADYNVRAFAKHLAPCTNPGFSDASSASHGDDRASVDCVARRELPPDRREQAALLDSSTRMSAAPEAGALTSPIAELPIDREAASRLTSDL